MALSFAGGTYLPPPPGVGGWLCSWYAEIFKEKTDTSPFRASWERLLCHVVPSAAAGFFSSSFESLVSRSCWDQMGSTTTPAITWLSAHYESDKVCFFNTSQGILHMSWSLFDSIFVSFLILNFASSSLDCILGASGGASKRMAFCWCSEHLISPWASQHHHDLEPQLETAASSHGKELAILSPKSCGGFYLQMSFQKNTHLAGFFWCTQFKKLCEMVKTRNCDQRHKNRPKKSGQPTGQPQGFRQGTGLLRGFRFSRGRSDSPPPRSPPPPPPPPPVRQLPQIWMEAAR